MWYNQGTAMSFVLSFHQFAGIGWYHNDSARIVLGWVSFTIFPEDIEEAIEFFMECEKDGPPPDME